VSMSFAQREDEVYREMAFEVAARLGKVVSEDIQHHFDKYGAQRLDLANWWMVIGEEEGEAIEAANKKDWENAKKEIRQVLACWIRFYVEVEREQAGFSELEKARYVRAQ
jgi:NTP pyrophosphatase (non-canonical NTP hydrolase)